MDDTPVWDLGSAEATTAAPARAARSAYDLDSVLGDTTPRPRPRAVSRTSPAVHHGPAFDPAAGTLSLLVPGAGQLLHRRPIHALFYLTAFGFLVSLGWSLLEAMPRIVATLSLFDWPRGAGFWALGLLWPVAAALHVATAVGAARDTGSPGRSPHPSVAGIASALIPGWGQLLHGRLAAAGAFLGAAWILAGLLLVRSGPVVELLSRHDLVLPPWLTVPVLAPAGWVALAVVWAIAAYDAATRTTDRA